MTEIVVGTALAAIGAGLAVGLAAIGSGMGVGIAGAAGAGVIAEKPDKFGLAIVFQALPQTQGIYGLLAAILILMATGLLGGGMGVYVPVSVGLAAIGVGLAVGLAGLSGIGQGITAASAIGAVSRSPDTMGRSLILTVMAETFALFGLLVAILIMFGIGMLGT